MKKLDVKPIPTDAFEATRPGFKTVALGAAVAISLVAIYYWPMIQVRLGL